ncbi:protein NTM1-like 9 isoform X1 [Ziziphus jujuba]|uniref:Protein NTM1-like 9 isoform X1 n=2 Tax=Ziziphus jujuba TaxID=326968 RepID=A0A6P4A6A6_ZIZJJ|nr:protein NTM1-like 9 isoform X1 [Ziziphus jujuba]
MNRSSTVLESMPVGFRFRPTEKELITHFLKLKMLGENSKVQDFIGEVDVCKFEPWELPAQSVLKSDDPEWFFFCRRDYKYTNSKRCNRATKAGYWKVTGKERQIKSPATKALIGKKRTLVFHKGRNPSEGTNWVIHEYYSVETFPDQIPFVLCRLMEKPDKKKIPNGDDGEPSSHSVACFENEELHDTIPEMRAYDHSDVNLDSIFRPSQPPDEYPSAQQQIDFPFPNGSSYAWNELQLPSEADEPDENPNEFVNSVFVDNDEYFWQDTTHPVFNVSGQSLPFPAHEDHGLRYLRSASSSSSFLNEPAGMEEYLQMEMVRTPSGTSNFDQFKKDINVPIHNQFSVQNASSVSLTKDLHSINCLYLATDSIIEKPREPEKPRKLVMPFAVPCKAEKPTALEIPKAPEKPCQPPRPIELIRTGVTSRRIQVKSEGLQTAESGNKVREAAAQNTAANLSQKEERDPGRKDERKTVQDKAACDVSPCGNWKSFFVFVEPPCKSSPPAVYFFSALIGVLLFAVFVREAFLFGNWC